MGQCLSRNQTCKYNTKFIPPLKHIWSLWCGKKTCKILLAISTPPLWVNQLELVQFLSFEFSQALIILVKLILFNACGRIACIFIGRFPCKIHVFLAIIVFLNNRIYLMMRLMRSLSISSSNREKKHPIKSPRKYLH